MAIYKTTEVHVDKNDKKVSLVFIVDGLFLFISLNQLPTCFYSYNLTQ